ncbi:MAG: hypothetical protein WCP11_01385 [Candidatus Saccharibacteria bacterium]
MNAWEQLAFFIGVPGTLFLISFFSMKISKWVSVPANSIAIERMKKARKLIPALAVIVTILDLLVFVLLFLAFFQSSSAPTHVLLFGWFVSIAIILMLTLSSNFFLTDRIGNSEKLLK